MNNSYMVGNYQSPFTGIYPPQQSVQNNQNYSQYLNPQVSSFEDWQKNSAQPDLQNPVGMFPNSVSYGQPIPTFEQQPIEINPNQIVSPNVNNSVVNTTVSPVSKLTPSGTTYGTPAEQLQRSANSNIGEFESNNVIDAPNLNNYNGGNIQFNNPYVGFDIQSGAGALGESIENKSPLGIVAGSLKVATGLGRSIFGAMGQQRRNNQVMKDYYERQRDDLTKATYMQNGGMMPVDENDLAEINSKSNVEFTMEGANQLFSKEVLTNTVPQTAQIKRQFFNPNEARIADITSGTNRYTDDGGVIIGDYKKVWTGKRPEEYVAGTTPLEGQDFMYLNPQQYKDFQNTDNYRRYKAGYPESTVTQAFQDGGKVSLPAALTGEYLAGMGKVNPMDTPNAEIEKDEFIKHPDGEVQKAVGDTHEKGGIDVNLEEGTKILSDHLKIGATLARELRKEHELKNIKANDTYASAMEKFSKKIGLTKIVEDQETTIKKLEEENKETTDEATLGLNTQHLSGKLNELEKTKIPLEEVRKKVFEDLFEAQEDSKPNKKEEEEEFEDGGLIKSLAEKHGVDYNRAKELFQNGGYSKKDREGRFNDFYNQAKNLGYTGEQQIGKIQAWMKDKYPDVVLKYFNEDNQPMTAKGIDLIRNQYPDAFSKAGIPADKASAQYTPEEKTALKNTLGDKLGNDFWLDQFNDNKFDWRYPQIPAGSNLEPAGQNNNGITAPVMQPIGGNNTELAPIDSTVIEDTGDFRNGINSLLLPDQTPMLPGSLQPHLKITRRFDRVDPALISAEQNIVEANRNQSAIFDQVNNVPGAQRAATLAGISANTQDNLNKVITQTNQFNSQAIAQADARNAQIQAVEENARAQDALSYEMRQLTAKAKTDTDINNYYNTIRERNVQNYNKVNDINFRNAIADHYQFDGNSYIQVDRPVIGAGRPLYSKTPEELQVEALEQAKAKRRLALKSKRFGGKI